MHALILKLSKLFINNLISKDLINSKLKMEQIKKEGQITILFGGKISVGKSNIAQKFCGVDNQLPYCINRIQKCGMNLKITLIDTLRHEIFGAGNMKNYFKLILKGGCLVLVYDITDRNSFEEMIKYYFESMKIQDRKFTYLLLGNKLDQSFNRQVSFSEGKSFSDSYGILFFEVSSLFKLNIEEAYNQLIEETIERIF
ncbi:Ras family small GTPase (macronuclear) [Tetrahymena thermophila SB210]|uniref:Ras family small GTPase n=1 Tax=Tetrahymena thermophila (strain SB210) TaxID=312017 RepID=Q229E4_TETTS|nr:Ras family small GTPase [Tetrahymena thermophila SB210]EAR81910.2 Ras family small GTPase [Tetrahymena thermophila SB210]|eukprot:XP_001029573.2 Ras family small GTPase [Tetrahymena thermophila SB210]